MSESSKQDSSADKLIRLLRLDHTLAEVKDPIASEQIGRLVFTACLRR